MNPSSLLPLLERVKSSNTVRPEDEEELRQAVRARIDGDLLYFCRSILGFTKLSDGLHRELCDFLQFDPAPEKCIQLPRGHLKTTICTIGYVLWRVVRNPNIRILIVTATATNAQKWIVMMEQMLLTNPALRFVYPEVIPSDLGRVRWNQDGFELVRKEPWPEATVEGIGVGGTAVSRHYDEIIEDDLVNEDHLITQEQMQKPIEAHTGAISLFINATKRRRLVVGNRWAFNDLISHIEEHETWFRHFKRAVREQGQPIWPEEFTNEGIDQILESQGPRKFSAWYMNQPILDDSSAFPKEWFQYFREIPKVPLRYYTAIDPAISQQKWADYTAIVTVGVDAQRNLYIVDARRDRWGMDEFIDNLFEVCKTYKPVRVGIEEFGFQRVLMYPIREAMRRHQVSYPIGPLKVPHRAKPLRIKALQEYFNNGSIWFREGLPKHLERELQEYPFGAHDDTADALASVVTLLANPASKTVTEDHNPLLLDNILIDLKNKKKPTNSVWTWHKSGVEVRA